MLKQRKNRNGAKTEPRRLLRAGLCDRRQGKVQFPKRLGGIRLDDDVIALANASAESIDWASQSHVINACMRRALAPFAPAGITLCVSPFEQLVFAKRITIKRTAPAMKPARRSK